MTRLIVIFAMLLSAQNPPTVVTHAVGMKFYLVTSNTAGGLAPELVPKSSMERSCVAPPCDFKYVVATMPEGEGYINPDGSVVVSGTLTREKVVQLAMRQMMLEQEELQDLKAILKKRQAEKRPNFCIRTKGNIKTAYTGEISQEWGEKYITCVDRK
jgi:hypothetical protein